jgi:cytoskeletal protein RodZ
LTPPARIPHGGNYGLLWGVKVMWRSVNFGGSKVPRAARLPLKVAAVASIGLLAACGPEGASTANAPVSKVEESASESTSSATPALSPTPTTTPTAATPSEVPTPTQPKIEKKMVVETRKIPFQKKTVNDPSLPKGKSVVTTRGVNGKKRVTYELTYTDGVQTGKRFVREAISTPPVTQITAIGTKVAVKPENNCDPNYSGGCVPIASDVDCEGGSGNGPAYVRGPVTVTGSDIYGLDRDGDGVGCED